MDSFLVMAHVPSNYRWITLIDRQWQDLSLSQYTLILSSSSIDIMLCNQYHTPNHGLISV